MSAVRQVIAVDWSGSASEAGQRKHIWAASVEAGGVQLEGGRTREELAHWLIAEAAREPALAVGLDFAFSFPEAFFRRRGLGSAAELWALAESEGEAWLAGCEPPFWGRPGKKKPASHEAEGHRQTDRAIDVGGIQPKSVLQIGGAGSVGTGSIRGMPTLRRLAAAGFAVWPFVAGQLPVVVEIYPRLLTGPVAKSREQARVEYLRAPDFATLAGPVRQAAEASEDALDALVSALMMWRHRAELAALPPVTDPRLTMEGCIWRPRDHTPATVQLAQLH